MSDGAKDWSQFEWPIGTERLGVVRVGRNTFIRSAVNAAGSPCISTAKLKEIAADVIASRQSQARSRKNRLTGKKRPA